MSLKRSRWPIRPGTAAWLSDGAAAPHGGNTIDDLFGHVSTWLDRAADRDGRVVAVTHSGVMRAAIVTIL